MSLNNLICKDQEDHVSHRIVESINRPNVYNQICKQMTVRLPYSRCSINDNLIYLFIVGIPNITVRLNRPELTSRWNMAHSGEEVSRCFWWLLDMLHRILRNGKNGKLVEEAETTCTDYLKQNVVISIPRWGPQNDD